MERSAYLVIGGVWKASEYFDSNLFLNVTVLHDAYVDTNNIY